MVNFQPRVKQTLLLMLLCVGFASFGQKDYFTNYSPLKAEGKIPGVFTQSTESKVEEARNKERSSMSKSEEVVFLESIHYRVDQILHSGLILYGDPATKYVQKVADKVLVNDRKLKKELQFYVIKSNVTNALSTDQGLIFVTLGLLGQLENEAQLAYVLAHEIVHYKESHVEKSYTEELNTSKTASYDDRITRLSSHSKDQELEADKRGLEMYQKAGYAKSELLGAFDVMMYSYLPFDEEPLAHSYYRDELLHIPDYYFPKEINEILAEEDYDDKKSSHPNIRKRKDQIIDELGEYSGWGTDIYKLTKEEFEQVRSIARFEGVRLDLLNKRYGDALYSIFLLEREFPNNLYLSRCKAQAWLGLATFKLNGAYSSTTQKPSTVEGESHAVHFLLRKLTKLQLLTVALRKIQDVHKVFPEDKELIAIRKQMVRNLAGYSKFSLSNYKPMNYEAAVAEFENSKAQLLAEDSLEVEKKDEESMSKYDKIKKKRNETSATSTEEEFDFKKFHIYALSDLVDDEEFKRLYRKEKDRLDEEEEEEERYDNMSRKELKEEFKLSASVAASKDGFILIEPSFAQYRYGQPVVQGSTKRSEIVLDALKSAAEKLDVTLHDLSTGNRSTQNTMSYNERSMLLDYLRQKAEFDDAEMFPVDYSYMGDLKTNYGDSKLLFVFAEYNSTMVTNRTELSAVLINMETGEIDGFEEYVFNQRPGKLVLKGFVYDMLSQLSYVRK